MTQNSAADQNFYIMQDATVEFSGMLLMIFCQKFGVFCLC